MPDRLRHVRNEVPVDSAPIGAILSADPITYRLVGFRPLMLIVFLGLGLVGVALVLNLLASGNGPPAAFVVLWLAAFGWNAYWLLIRTAYEIGIVDGSMLRWCTFTGCHEVPLTSVTALRTPIPPFDTGFRRMIIEGDRSPIIMVSSGFRDVVSMVVQFRPGLAIETAWYDRLAERLNVGSPYWRRT
jgi:hypothetical protein